MSQHRPDENNPMDPFGMMKGLRDSNMDAWSKMMQQFVNTEGYAQATGKMLDTYLTTSAPFRNMIEQSMTHVLTQLNMPTRGDVTGLAERLTNIEMRLDDLDAKLDTLLQSRNTAEDTAATSGKDRGSDTPPAHKANNQETAEEKPKPARPPSKSRAK
jgi:hypothetical protein